MADQRHLGLGPDPSLHPVAPDQEDEAGAGPDLVLELIQPGIGPGDVLLIAEHVQAVAFKLAVQIDSRLQVAAAVTEEDVVMACHPEAPTDSGCFRLEFNRQPPKRLPQLPYGPCTLTSPRKGAQATG